MGCYRERVDKTLRCFFINCSVVLVRIMENPKQRRKKEGPKSNGMGSAFMGLLHASRNRRHKVKHQVVLATHGVY